MPTGQQNKRTASPTAQNVQVGASAPPNKRTRRAEKRVAASDKKKPSVRVVEEESTASEVVDESPEASTGGESTAVAKDDAHMSEVEDGEEVLEDTKSTRSDSPAGKSESEQANNPFESFDGILSAKFEDFKRLRQADVVVSVYTPDGETGMGDVPVVVPHLAYPSDGGLIDRFVRILVTEKIGEVLNLSFMDNFDELQDRGGYVKNVHANFIQRFFIIATVAFSGVHSDDGSNKQLCVIPWAHVFERGLAGLSRVFGSTPFFIQTYQNGISFSTSWKSKGENTNTNTYAAINKRSTSSKQNNARRPPATLSHNANVPVYDGRNEFDLRTYNKLDELPGEIDKGSAVLVFFTVKRYDLKADQRSKYDVPDKYGRCLSFNIQEAVLLADPDTNATPPTNFDLREFAKGVEFLPEASD